MNGQKGTVKVIVQGKGNYVLDLKGNQPLFYDTVKTYFEKEFLHIF